MCTVYERKYQFSVAVAGIKTMQQAALMLWHELDSALDVISTCYALFCAAQGITVQIEPGSIPYFQFSWLISGGKIRWREEKRNPAICTAAISIQTRNEVEFALYYIIEVMSVRDENGKRRYEHHTVLFLSHCIFFLPKEYKCTRSKQPCCLNE